MSPQSWTAIIIAVLVALIGSPILSALFVDIRNRKLTEATAADIIQKAAGGLVTTLDERVKDLEKKSTEQEMEIENLRRGARKQEKEIEVLRRGVRLLIKQIKSAGLVPVWQPEDPALE